MAWSDVVVIDDIPVAPSVIPNPECIQQYSHLIDISLAGGLIRILIGNIYVTAHRCFKSTFSPDPEESSDAILTPLGWVLRGPHLRDHRDPLDETSSNFLVCGIEWPPDMQELEDMLITNQVEFFATNSTTDLGDKEDTLKI